MNLLYIMQQSIYNNEGKWISADSNINMGVGILKEILAKTDWNIYVLIGNLSDFADIKSYDELLKHERLTFISYPFPVDAFLNRQNFDVKEWERMFKNIPQPNVIWNNIPELSRNIKTYLYYKKIPSKLISSCYWLDTPSVPGQNKVPEEISYQWRQYDGFECSDLVTFTCQSTKDSWIINSKNKFNIEDNTKILEKSKIFDFGYSMTEMSAPLIQKPKDKKTILFLNRMSPSNYTCHLEFIEAVNKLYEKRKDFKVVFTNPSQKVSWEELKDKVKPIEIISENPLNRQQYINLLWESDISVHLYTNELYGGCANVESIYCRNLPLMPRVFEYAKRMQENYPGYLSENFNIDEMVEKLNILLDLNETQSKEYLDYGQNYVMQHSSFEYISDHVIESIKKIMG